MGMNALLLEDSPQKISLGEVWFCPRKPPVHLRAAISAVRGRWDLIVDRINYLDALSLGYRPCDPFDSVNWSGFEFDRKKHEGSSNLAWCKLQVLNHSFEMVRETAELEKIDFPFCSPRQMFLALLREQIEFELRPILTDGVEQGETLSSLREIARLQSKMYRQRLNGKEEIELSNWLNSGKNESWAIFWHYVIFRNFGSLSKNREFERAWKRLLASHKEMVALTNEASGTVQWTHGKPVSASRKVKQPTFSGVILYGKGGM